MKAHQVALIGLAVALLAGGTVFALSRQGADPKRSASEPDGESKIQAASAVGAEKSSAIAGLVGTWHNQYQVAFQPGKEVTWDTTLMLDGNFEYRAVVLVNKTTIRHSGNWRVEGNHIKYARKTCQVEGGSSTSMDICENKDSPGAKYELKGDVLELQSDVPNVPLQKFARASAQ